jgi:hypothetical protein
MTTGSIEISVHGKWVEVPALDMGGRTIIVKGKLIRTAVVHDEDWLDSELQDPESYVRQLKESTGHGLRADIFTFAQMPPASRPKYDYPVNFESVAVARTSNFKEWWEKLPQETRKNVRRSQKRGVIVTVNEFNDDMVRKIVELNNDCPVRQGRPNNHYGKSFEQVKKDYSSFLDRSDLIGAYAGDELIGLVKVVYRGQIASILQCMPNARHSDKRPANALIAKTVELCEAKGISHLTYGQFHYGNKGDNPLLEFKIRNGFEEMLAPRYYVPLTSWGSFCISSRLHKGLLGIVPQSVITLGIGARSKWYDFVSRRQKSRCSSIAERPNCDRQMECSNPPAGSNL